MMHSGDDRQLTLLHWNIHSWRTPDGKPSTDAVAELLSELTPDVVSLVEVDEPWGEARRLQDVAERTGYTWMFVPAFTFGNTGPEGGFGNALLVRSGLAIRGTQQWDLLWPGRVYDGTEPSEARTVLLAELDAGAYRIWIGTTHLPRSDRAARDDALKRLIALTGTLGEAWLICGDFNTPAATWVPSSVTSTPVLPTYPADQPTEAIDYAVASPTVHVKAEVIPSLASDHLAVRMQARLVI